MKSVTFSDIEPVQARAHRLPRRGLMRRLATLALLLAIGLPALMIAFHLLDPTAPLGYIVVPVLLGGLLPITQVLPGRFEVKTRFDACHMVVTLDETLGRLGYQQAERGPGSVRYRARGGRWPSWLHKEIDVTVKPHALEVVGPMPALRALRLQMQAH
ncbi:hypothetical protein [Massilia sp. 9096]|uniref:hypothetical protein n=1 Tax=Massilia sp. 9096 TaxID=1500894 RepID=UPI00055BEF23|nr:hypothetical protein [Massilia sp. 9096]